MDIVTGGCGFIGGNFVKLYGEPCAVFDRLTYAAGKPVPGVRLYQNDICDAAAVRAAIEECKPEWIIHFAAESHVDSSIENPHEHVRTNVQGTTVLAMEAARAGVKFLHVSTDEVYGTAGPSEQPFVEADPYRPNNPYAASKAASDLMVRSFIKCYGLKAIVTHCTNNYGPGQHNEKLVPSVIERIRDERPVKVHGTGLYIRDWIHVLDHCTALQRIMDRGRIGETYNISANCERTNLQIIEMIGFLMRRKPKYQFVEDRPAQDLRYALNASKLRALGWKPRIRIEEGMAGLVARYPASSLQPQH